MLIHILNSIQQPAYDDEFQFAALPIPNYPNHRIAKDKSDNPALLLSIPVEPSQLSIANVRLQNVSVLFDIKCKIQQCGKRIEKQLTAICFIGTDNSLKIYFLRLCSTLVRSLGNTPTREEVRTEITHFIELFRLVTEPQMKTIQGLWAELLLIVESRDPANLLMCWHCIPEERFDFNNGEERIEVKSSSTSLRIHTFSLDQLHSPNETKTIIASMFVKQTSAGKSIATLTNEIVERLSGRFELIDKLHLQIAMSLGRSIGDSIKLTFDFEFARDSLRFYRAEDIPTIAVDDVPQLVTNVRFQSDLSDIGTLNRNELSGNKALFNSI